MSLNKITKFENSLEILGGYFSIFYNDVEVVKNVLTTNIEVDYIPPYDHIVYAFKTVVSPLSLKDFRYLVERGGVWYSKECKISNGFVECNAFIDGYETRQSEPIQLMNAYGFGSTISSHFTRETIIYGHIDSRDFESRGSKKPEKEIIIEEINSRFDILDL